MGAKNLKELFCWMRENGLIKKKAMYEENGADKFNSWFSQLNKEDQKRFKYIFGEESYYEEKEV